MMAPWIYYYCLALFLILNCHSTTAQMPYSHPTANLSTTWTINESLPISTITFDDGSRIQPILLSGSSGPKFACGFYCNGTCPSYLFAVYIALADGVHSILPLHSPQVVWSANRDHPVKHGATLSLTATGELVLQDADGKTAWTTNTTRKSVAGLNLTEDGNLVLFNVNRSVVWQSFDHPTDCLVPGQRLFVGQQLIPSVSSTNWTAQKGLFSLQVTYKGLFAYVGSNPPQTYYRYSFYLNDTRYAQFSNGSLSVFFLSDPSYPFTVFEFPKASSVQCIKFMPDGHLKVFEWKRGWEVVADIFSDGAGSANFEECDYPMACGRNGICSGTQQCTCPVSSSPRIDYFRAKDDRQPNFGCSEITPLTCNANAIQDQTFIVLENVTYFNDIPDIESVDMETCKQACVINCSCKAALFQYGSNSSDGNCFLLFELFTMMNVDPNIVHFNSSVFIKVQNVRLPPSASTSRSPQLALGVILASTIESILFLLGVTGFRVYIIRKRRLHAQMEEDPIGELGEGGFGAVFEGTLEDGLKIAVKCLEGLGQVNKSFLAEVQSIGSIHM
ncbi:hypothetical protein L1987_16081 [Smallanthus sonchifolius]|uniref:Uncharacterized protein n=1 Tax=Smallanthus sonchifolius TaxID=185202 RepID=A0ACB9JAU8_9ASTR|nr:hypothetical protein L1987_16081 [Smallanthus sonchifolius]